jgi:hypothetical protein
MLAGCGDGSRTTPPRASSPEIGSIRTALSEIDRLAQRHAYNQLCERVVITQSASTAIADARRLGALTGAAARRWNDECSRLLRTAAATPVPGTADRIRVTGREATADYTSTGATETVHLLLVAGQWRLVIPVDAVG